MIQRKKTQSKRNCLVIRKTLSNCIEDTKELQRTKLRLRQLLFEDKKKMAEVAFALFNVKRVVF